MDMRRNKGLFPLNMNRDKRVFTWTFVSMHGYSSYVVSGQNGKLIYLFIAIHPFLSERTHWFWHMQKFRKITIYTVIISCVTIFLLSVCHGKSSADDNLGPVSISDKTSYRKISWSLAAARLVVKIIASLWNLSALRQHSWWCRGASQISERLCNSKYKSRSFETLLDLTIRQ